MPAQFITLRNAIMLTLASLAGSCIAPGSITTGSMTTGSMTAVSVDLRRITCAVGPDGAAPVADRGLGGTGAPPSSVADRGIGGTGIIGVVTGFGSICVGANEIALDPDVPIRIDGKVGGISDLRAGQFVAAVASGERPGLSARRIAVRHEVVGKVEQARPGQLRVAGQDVAIVPATWAGASFRAGDWVDVSGLHRPDGTIEATRLDAGTAGLTLVHGVLTGTDQEPRIGRLRLPPLPTLAAAGAVRVGQAVTATGTLAGDDFLSPASLDVDLVVEDPRSYFGPTVTTVLVEGIVSSSPDGRLGIGPTALPGLHPSVGPAQPTRGVVELSGSPPGAAQPGSSMRGVAPGAAPAGPSRGGAPTQGQPVDASNPGGSPGGPGVGPGPGGGGPGGGGPGGGSGGGPGGGRGGNGGGGGGGGGGPR